MGVLFSINRSFSPFSCQCISGWDTLENAFLPSNSPQIELSTILSPSSRLKVEKNNFPHQKMTFLIIQYAIFYFKAHLRSNLSRNLTYLRPIWVLLNKTISKIFGRSPQKSVAVHPRCSWPFTLEVRGRSPKKFVAVHPRSPWPFTPRVGDRSPQK